MLYCEGLRPARKIHSDAVTQFLPFCFEEYIAESAAFIRASLSSLWSGPASTREGSRLATPMELVMTPALLRAFSPPGRRGFFKKKSRVGFLGAPPYFLAFS